MTKITLSHDEQKDVEGSGGMMSYNMLNTC